VGSDQLDPWDIGYYGRKVEEERFALDPEEVRKYFQLEKVLVSMFSIAEKLFGLKITTVEWNTWHSDVRTLKITKGKEVMGYISMDLHPRAGKYTHAMAHNICDPGIHQWGSTTYEVPMTAIVANFRGPTKKTPSQLSFDEVTTLFHEFGHALHNTLTTAWIPSQAGFNTVWDFVELPSQIFEEWAWLPEVITKMSAHVDDGSKMEKQMMNQLIGSRSFLEGLFLTRQIAMAEFDMQIHEQRPKEKLNNIYKKITPKYSPLPISEDSLFPSSFAHIMHGYDAGYYSYLWSRVYAYECFAVFKKNGVTSGIIGKQYWGEILSQGSSRDEMKSLKAFLGKSPSVKAFINHLLTSAQYE
jgi:thimet oligopeptidase